MKRLAVLAIVVSLAACGTNTTSATLLTSYDSAVVAETAYLTAHPNPADATRLRALRLQANSAVQAVVAAERAGGQTAALMAAAVAAVNAYATASKGN